MNWLMPGWQPIDTQIVFVGALAAAACALVGTFLVLRRLSMMGDAISHAVLPGLALAFLLTDSRASVVMLVGAGVVGVLTALFTELIQSAGRVDRGASMGVVFTILFAVGLILLRQAADHVDLDPDCVLYGAIELVPLDVVRVAGWNVPRAGLMVGGVLLMNVLAVALLYKELKISTFDPALATAQGINARLMHYVLMTLVAITTVAAFESVGSILVIAMLIVPPAAAFLLTDRLSVMLLLSVALAALSAVAGHAAALSVPGWLGFEGVSASSAGMMGVCAGLLFVLAALLGPRHGALSKLAHRAALALRIAREDALGLSYRLEELGRPAPAGELPRLLARASGASALTCRLAVRGLLRRGLLTRRESAYEMTPLGRQAAQSLVRSHRLWEAYLERHVAAPTDHLHRPAEALEHVTDAALSARLAASLDDPQRDPHGRPIPQ